MFNTLSILDWVRCGLALVLFTGSGAALVSFHPGRSHMSLTTRAVTAVLLSLAAWPVLLAWLQLLRVPLPPAALTAFLAGAWLLALWRGRPYRWTGRAWPSPETVLLWLTVALAAGAAVYSLRDLASGPGSDAYHHMLITQLIVDRRGLPSDYAPYAPLISFTYHFGFHAFAAAIVHLSGLPALVVVPLVAQCLVGVAALAVARLTHALTRSGLAAFVSAVVVACLAVFPAYLINYGRYTQLLGTLLLAGLLAEFAEWRAAQWGWSRIPFLAVLAAGIVLTHYRVTLMAAIGIAVVFGVDLLLQRTSLAAWRGMAVRWLALAGAALLLVSPWIVHVLSQRDAGYSLETIAPGATFFSLSRLGPVVLNYPTNGLLLVLLTAAIVTAALLRDRQALLMAGWGLVMYAGSMPFIGGEFMDTVSVVISIFVPAAFIIGAMVARLVELNGSARRILRPLVLAASLIIAVLSLPRLASIADVRGAFVQNGDLPAFEWVRANVPASARFMVNTYHWDFAPDYPIGIDAGFWLPLLAERQTVTMPMTFSIERGAEPDLLTQLVALDQLGGRLTIPEGQKALREAGVTHVFLGVQGGPISAENLLSSPLFELLYAEGGAYVFALR